MSFFNTPRITTNSEGDRFPPGYWTLEKAIAQFKVFRDENDLREKSVSILLKTVNPRLSAALNMFGGFKKLNEEFKLGLKLGRAKCSTTQIKSSKASKPGKKTATSTGGRIKWTKERVIDEYRAFYLRHGQFPTVKDFAAMGKAGIPGACYKYFKTTGVLRKMLSLPSDHRKERNYWTLQNTIKELKEFIEADPDHKTDVVHQLRMQNRYGLSAAIYKHGGLYKLNKQFGLGLPLRKKQWSKRAVLQELRNLTNKNVQITQYNLAKLGRQDLAGAVAKFGGLNALKSKLGLAIKRHSYWTDELILKELKPIVTRFGKIPSRDILKAMGKADLAYAMKKRGTIKKFSDLLNITSLGYCKANDNHYLNSAYECLFDNILFKYNIPHSVNGIITPTSKYRYDFLIGDTYIEICGYDKKEHPHYFQRLASKKRLYKRLNLKYIVISKDFFLKKFDTIEKETLKIVSGLQTSRPIINKIVNNDIIPSHYWKDLKNVKRELIPLVKKYKRIPLDRELRKERKSSLITGVYKYHGFFYEVAQKLKLKIKYKPKGFYNEENSVNEYRQLCLKHKRFLTLQDLQHMQRYGVAGYISKNGGFYKIRRLTNLPYAQMQLPKGYYTPNKAISEYKQQCLAKDGFISYRGLVKMGKASLAAYISTSGGFYIIRRRTGLKFPPLRKPRKL